MCVPRGWLHVNLILHCLTSVPMGWCHLRSAVFRLPWHAAPLSPLTHAYPHTAAAGRPAVTTGPLYSRGSAGAAAVCVSVSVCEWRRRLTVIPAGALAAPGAPLQLGPAPVALRHGPPAGRGDCGTPAPAPGPTHMAPSGPAHACIIPTHNPVPSLSAAWMDIV